MVFAMAGSRRSSTDLGFGDSGVLEVKEGGMINRLQKNTWT